MSDQESERQTDALETRRRLKGRDTGKVIQVDRDKPEWHLGSVKEKGEEEGRKEGRGERREGGGEDRWDRVERGREGESEEEWLGGEGRVGGKPQ